MTLTREERETAIILSDGGSVTVWTSSPVRLRQLTKRLGASHRQLGACHFWDLDPEKHSIPLPRKRGKPKNPPIGARFGTKPTPREE